MIAKASIPLRAFNEAGRQKWNEYIRSLKNTPDLDLPPSLLEDEALSYQIQADDIPELINFQPDTNKLEFASGLSPLIQHLYQSRIETDDWPGIWDWLAAYYFDLICPLKADGTRAPKGKEWYAYSEAYNRQYKHRIAGPIDLYLRHGEDAKLLLLSTKKSLSPASQSQLEDEIASRQELSRSTGIIGALNRLYLDPVLGTQKGGAVANTKKPGTIRRFCDVMGQFERTFDTSEIPADSLVELLPSKEFGKWLK